MNYATALRCIGQELERRGLKSFDIRLEGKTYMVDCGYQEPPSPMPVSLRYDVKDLVELDRAGETKRGESMRAREFINPVQIFRTIGGYLDKNEARLLRLANSDRNTTDAQFTVEYINRDGDRIVDDRAGAAIYDLCVQMYKQRGKLTGTGGRRGWRR